MAKQQKKFERPEPQALDAALMTAPEAQGAAIPIQDWTPNTPEETTLMAWGIGWMANTPCREWSISASEDGNEVRFELRDGEQYAGNWPDGEGTERCEMGMKDRPSTRGNTFVISYDYMIEGGDEISSGWLTSGQLHSALNCSPPTEMAFHGSDNFDVSANSGSSSNIDWNTAWTDDDELERDVWHQIHWNVELDANGGTLILWRNGEEQFSYHGPVGYSDQTNTYWKMGVYRKRPPGGETVAVRVRNWKMKQGEVLPYPPQESGGGGGGIDPGPEPEPDTKTVYVTVEAPEGVEIKVEINEI
jgi:hypothetical protein